MSTPVLLRLLEPGDAEVLAAFYNGLSPASKRTFRPLGETTTVETCREIALCGHAAGDDGESSVPTKYDLVAVRDGVIIGWSFIWNLDTEAPVFGLAVTDAHHGRGLGSRLMATVMAWARSQRLPQVCLTVVQDNLVAQHIYEKAGFIRYGEFAGDDGLPYYRMRANLIS